MPVSSATKQNGSRQTGTLRNRHSQNQNKAIFPSHSGSINR
jgi:hypothetical protein